jgi:hypothetical protein
MYCDRFAAILSGLLFLVGSVLSADAFDYKKSYSAPTPKVSTPSTPSRSSSSSSSGSSRPSSSSGSSRPSSSSSGSSYSGSRSSSPSGGSSYGGSRSGSSTNNSGYRSGPAQSAPTYNSGSGRTSPSRDYSSPATSSGARSDGQATMKFSAGNKGAPQAGAKTDNAATMKFSAGNAKSTVNPTSGPGTMKFSAGGAKPANSPAPGSGTMKFSAGGAKGASPAEGRSGGYGSMKMSTGAGKTAQQTKPVYSLPADHKAGLGKSSAMTKANSESVLNQVNSARAKLPGANSRPVPQGQVSVLKDGGLSIAASGGRSYKMRTDGTLASFSGKGVNASFNPQGKVRTLRTDRMEINRGPRGERRIHSVRPDKSVLVATGHNRGYLQRTVSRNNRNYVQRTYLHGNKKYTHEYTPYSYNGVGLECYTPRAVYSPALYGWAGNPWPAPVAYQWGWGQEPWYAANAGYFTALSSYQDATQMLADYIVAETMKSDYQDPVESNEPPLAEYAKTDTPVSSEVRQEIAQEIRYQLEQEREAALNPNQNMDSGELVTALNDPNHLFVVSNSIVTTTHGEACGLTAGDVLQLTGTPPEGVQTVTLRVISSKRMDCPANLVVTVALSDLQAMHNNMREQLYAGLDLLRTSQGSKGLPSAPPEAIAAPRPTDVAGLSPADADLRSLVAAQVKEADKAEAEVIQTAYADDARKN